MEHEHDHPPAAPTWPAAPSHPAPPPRDPAYDDHAADVHALNRQAEQLRRQVARARAAGEPEPTFGPLSEAPDLYSFQARHMTRLSTAPLGPPSPTRPRTAEGGPTDGV